MEVIECPRCGEKTIKPIDRFKMGKWLNIHCSHCRGRLCANPIFMALMYFALAWDIFFFGFMAVYEKSWIYAGVLVFIWAILEFFLLYMPITRLKALKQNNV